MHAEKQPMPGPDAPVRHPQRRWPWITAIVVVGLIVFVAILPYLASIGLIRNGLLRAAMPRVNGTVRAGGARLGWFSPIHFEDVEIRSLDGEPVVSIARLEGDRALWRMVFGRDLGELRVERPRIDVVIDRGGSNLRRVFPKHKLPNVSLGVKVVGGRVSVRGGDAARPWTAEPVNFAFRLRPRSASADGQPRLEIEPGVVFSDAPLASDACRDLLKYIAPVVANATEVSGRFSVEVDRCEFPLMDFAQGEGSGRLTIHKLALGPGPLVHELAAFVKLPPDAVTVEEETVTFRMAQGRIHHSRLPFRLQRLQVTTSGSVGMDDRSLEMVAKLALPEDLWDERPLLANKTLRIPIGGTLDKPKIDGKAVLQSLRESGLEVLSDAWTKGQLDLSEIFKAVRQRRQERRERQANPSKQPNGEPRRPLGSLLRGIVEGAAEKAGSRQ